MNNTLYCKEFSAHWMGNMILLNRILHYYSRYLPKHQLPHKYGFASQEAADIGICRIIIPLNINLRLEMNKAKEYKLTARKHQ